MRCRYTKVSKNAYYQWIGQKDKAKADNAQSPLQKKVRQIFQDSHSIYGSCRIQKQLGREGLHYSRSYISRLMKSMGLKSILKKKFVVTTDSKHSCPISGNILDRSFASPQLGEKWVSDITYVRVGGQWNYLTTI